jgi:hypothetical protein
MTFAGRVIRVLALDAATFEEIEADRRATPQALAVVVIASVAAGIGSAVVGGPVALVRATLAALIGWVMWAAVTYVIGARFFPEPQTRTDMGELLRVIGFSYAPQAFNLLAFVPVAGRAVPVIVAFWLFATTVIAVRQALDYKGTGRAVLVVLIGWLIFVLITAVF